MPFLHPAVVLAVMLSVLEESGLPQRAVFFWYNYHGTEMAADDHFENYTVALKLS